MQLAWSDMTSQSTYPAYVTGDPPWLVALATLLLAAASWWRPIREIEAPWPSMVGFYGGFFGAAIAGDAGHWLLAGIGLAVAMAATAWLLTQWWVSRRTARSGDDRPKHRRSREADADG